jgi:hypothetical protein
VPFILEYQNECGSPCHDSMREIFLAEGFPVYDIITSRHGFVFTTHKVITEVASNTSSLIEDYVPFLPELKVDADLDLENDCRLNSVGSIALQLLLVSLTKYQLKQFIGALSSQSSSSDLFTLPSPLDLLNLLPNQENILLITINCSTFSQHSHSSLFSLTHYSEVLWIEKSYPMKSSMKWANGVTQSGKYSKQPLYAANLTGNGQIIGIADSGIDMESCFFRDPHAAVPYDHTNYSHRKVIQYVTYQDNQDENGHGTSVSGAAAGLCITSDQQTEFELSDYHGAAENAKISFFDVGQGTSSDIYPPSNYYSGLFSVLYTSGARIMSMSWGGTSNSYTAQARYIDQFMWDYPETLIIYAAGNSGLDGYNTVGSPATNKNGIAVGASMNDEQSWNAQGKVSTKEASLSKHGLAYFSSKGPTFDGRLKPEICSIGE